jgi:hypothetical protein
MNKEKQIEEMAKLLHLNYDMPYEFSKGLAEFLFDEGYRKASEVAREIFEEIESISSDFPIYGNINTVILSERDLAFIKKKYTEEGK